MLGAAMLAQTYLAGEPDEGTPTPPVEDVKGYAVASDSQVGGAKGSDE